MWCTQRYTYRWVHQLFGRMCSILFLAFTLKLPIQTLLSVVPTHSVFWHATQFQKNEHTPGYNSHFLPMYVHIRSLWSGVLCPEGWGPEPRGVYNILRITIVYVFEQHEYLISCHLIWAVLCSLLYDQEGSLKNLSIYLLRCLSLEYLMVSDVQRTYVQQGLV